MAKPAFKFEIGADNPGDDGLLIEVNPDNSDDGDDFTLSVRIKRPKPDKPKPKLQLVSKVVPPVTTDDEEDGAALWYAHMLS